MSAVKIALQRSQKSGRKQSSKSSSEEVSPDSKCPICLDRFNNISYLDICLHKFCFRCIQEWSKNKAQCPLCKQPFNSIYHSIESDHDFKKYDLRPVDNGSFGTFEGVRFRYRTTLTGVRRHMEGARTSAPPDNGVIFEPSLNPPQQRQDPYVRRMMMRLAAKRRAAREGRAVSNIREQEMVNFRRELYRQGVRVRSIRDGGRSRDTSAEFYRRNPACLHRLIPWLKRELVVLYGAHGSLVNIVQHIIMSRITRFDVEDQAIQEELRPFLQGRTEHFLHEFISFAKAPFNMEAYDEHAVYDCPTPSSNEDGNSNSSVIAISEDEIDSAELSHPGDATSSLSHSMWDDETPGPSFSTAAEQIRTEHQSILDSDSDSSLEEETQQLATSPRPTSPINQTNLDVVECDTEERVLSDSDDCVIVSFVKPTVERTPELVQLSSDSENEDTKKVPLLPRHIRFTSPSPAASQSSDVAKQSKNEESDRHQVLDSRTRQSSSASAINNPLRMSDRTERGGDSAVAKRSKERNASKDRGHRRRGRRKRSVSGEHSLSCRSPKVSSSTYSTERGYLYPSGREYSKYDSTYRRRGGDHTTYQSYSHYSEERSESGTHCTQRKSYYYSSRKYSERRSRSRSRSRDSLQRGRRHSRSRTCSSSRSPLLRSRSHHDKPGGKRKYKTRHLEEPSEGDTKHKRKNKEKRHKKSKERSRKTSRSVSVELVNDGEACERSRRHHKKKKKHKKSKSHRSGRSEKRSPTVITIDSNSDSFSPGHVTQTSGTNNENPVQPSSQDAVDANVMDKLC